MYISPAVISIWVWIWKNFACHITHY